MHRSPDLLTGADMDQECTDAYCLLEEFLKQARMKRGVFYWHY